MRSLAIAAAAALAAAQPTWYAIAPRFPPGFMDFFEVTPQGVPVKQIAILNTSDLEYPKTGTLHCAWGPTGNCYFLTGVQGDAIQDSIYTVTKAGVVVNKFTLPAGVYVDNLSLDWSTTPPTLYSVAFDPQTRRAGIIDLVGGTGAKLLLDITADVAGGFVYPGGVTICAQEHHLFVAVDVFAPSRAAFPDYALRYDVSLATPKLLNRFPTQFPTPGALRAFCNASGLVNMIAITEWNAGEDRADGLLGVVAAGPRGDGYFVPAVQSALPERANRFDPRELQLTGLASEHAGIFTIALYPDFVPQAPFAGFIWTVDFTKNPPVSATTESRFPIAGISGVPN